ncbi:hypothetical protein GCM10010464_67290 [Pseudonocardia yunnanensis]
MGIACEAAALLYARSLDEMLELADRVAMFHDGRLAGPFPRVEVDRERIGALMAGDRDRDGRQEEIG